MTGIDSSFINDFIAAAVCGAFIGMEREFGKADATGAPPEPAESRNLAGIRTHILTAILGALACILDREIDASPWFTCLSFGALALFIVAAHGVRAARTGHYGMTSVPTLLLTYGLGVLCISGQRTLALALSVVVTAILAVKIPLHSFIRGLKREELTAAIKFGLLALVLLPVLPDRDFGPNDWPWLAGRLRAMSVREETLAQLALVNPHTLWLLVVVISGVGFAGYVLVRALGPGRGLVLTGLAGGLVSSTSVALAMAEQSRRTPAWKDPIAAAVLAACAVMTVRVLVVAVALQSSLFLLLAPPLGAMLVASVIVVLWLVRRKGSPKVGGDVPVTTPLAILPALKLAGLMFAVRVLSEFAVLAIGNAGLILMAALSGIVDVDALTIAASQQAAASGVSDGFAAAAICVAVAVNTIAKGSLLLITGDRATGRTTFVALLITLAGGAAGYAIMVLAT